jgi:ribosomal protein S9
MTATKHSDKYFEAVGRRKTAVARVRLFPGKSGYDINGKTLEAYFPVKEMQITASEAIAHAKVDEKFHVSRPKPTPSATALPAPSSFMMPPPVPSSRS